MSATEDTGRQGDMEDVGTTKTGGNGKKQQDIKEEECGSEQQVLVVKEEEGLESEFGMTNDIKLMDDIIIIDELSPEEQRLDDLDDINIINIPDDKPNDDERTPDASEENNKALDAVEADIVTTNETPSKTCDCRQSNTKKSTEDKTEEYDYEPDNSVPELETTTEEDTTIKSACKHSSTSKLSTKTVKSDKPKDGRIVWVKNINPLTTANRLKLDLSKYGKVLNAKIVTNGEKYYGYALMDHEESAKQCIEKLNGITIKGYTVTLSLEQPQKTVKTPKKAADKKTVDKKVAPTTDKKEPRSSRTVHKRDVDPLTLRVRSRSRSSSRRRLLAKKRAYEEESARIKRQREEVSRLKRQREEEHRMKREEEIRLKHNRELKLQIEMEKKKLEYDKRLFEKEKAEFMRLQRKMDEEKRAREEREKREKELERSKCSKSPRQWRRSKSPPKKSVASSITDNRNRKRKSISPIKTNQYISWSPKRDKATYRRDDRVPPPPPPRITNNEIPRLKNDPWKPDNKKIKVDYFKSKENFGSNINEMKKDIYHPNPDMYDKRYRDERGFNPKYIKDDDKYKEKKRIYDCKDVPAVRSEVYQPSLRNSYPPIEPPRRFEMNFQPQYGGRYPNNMDYQPQQNFENNWNRPNFPKEYQENVPQKNFHPEHPRYDERHQYFAHRKY